MVWVLLRRESKSLGPDAQPQLQRLPLQPLQQQVGAGGNGQKSGAHVKTPGISRGFRKGWGKTALGLQWLWSSLTIMGKKRVSPLGNSTTSTAVFVSPKRPESSHCLLSLTPTHPDPAVAHRSNISSLRNSPHPQSYHLHKFLNIWYLYHLVTILEALHGTAFFAEIRAAIKQGIRAKEEQGWSCLVSSGCFLREIACCWIIFLSEMKDKWIIFIFPCYTI